MDKFVQQIIDMLPVISTKEANSLLLLVAASASIIALIFSLIAISRAKKSKIGPGSKQLDARIQQLALKLDDFDGRWNTRLTNLERSHDILQKVVKELTEDELLKKKSRTT